MPRTTSWTCDVTSSLTLLRDESAEPAARAAALRMLLLRTPSKELIPAVERFLTHHSPLLRGVATKAILLDLRSLPHRPLVQGMLSADTHPQVRAQAAQALGWFARATLAVRDQTLCALAKQVVLDPEPWVQRACYQEWLHLLDPDVDDSELYVSFDAARDVDVKLLAPYLPPDLARSLLASRPAARALPRRGMVTEDDLRLLRDPAADSPARVRALTRVCHGRTAAALSMLLRGLIEDPDAALRFEVVFRLAEDPRHAELLLVRLRRDADPSVRGAVATCVGQQAYYAGLEREHPRLSEATRERMLRALVWQLRNDSEESVQRICYEQFLLCVLPADEEVVLPHPFCRDRDVDRKLVARFLEN